MLKFGFELEGFYRLTDNSITLPPRDFPVDGFPGLCEVRTNGGKDLSRSYFELLEVYSKYQFDIHTFEHTFSPADKRLIRSRHNEKTAVNINNIYGKEPKALGNRTIASFQINISNLVRSSYTDEKGVFHQEQYGLFDFYPIIKALDKEFDEEILKSKRQKGFYSVKDGVRVEYRSLPNFVFETDYRRANALIERIEHCTKGRS